MATMNSVQRRQAFKERLQRCASLALNKVCSECPESDPTWASILQPPLPGGQRLGVLCCYKCSTFHFQLGKQVCTVKNIKMVEEWTEEEIQTLETMGGNQIVNALYEAGLNSAAYNKWRVRDDPQEEDASRKEFIINKYQQREYFDPVLYQAHLQRMQSTTDRSAGSNPRKPTRQARRCRSFEDETNTKLERCRKQAFVRKPMRRRSQSFQKDRKTDDESTDDDQRLSYNLPGHLMSASAPEANGKRRQRRSSMPGLQQATSTNSKPTPRSTLGREQRKQRRATTKAAVLPRGKEQDMPSDAELGYGTDDQDSHNHHNTDMDSTRRRSNRRRDSNGMSESSSRWGSGRRRKSMPTVGIGASPGASQDYDDDASITSIDTCHSNAPKMPTRCVSDDSGDDVDIGLETEDDGFVSPSPTASTTTKTISDRIPRRMRRTSMPAAVSSDEDNDRMAMTMGHAYSPSLPRLTRFDTNKSTGKYGIDLGYGFANPNGTIATRRDSSTNPQPQIEVEVQPARLPTRLPQNEQLPNNGGPAFKRSYTNPCRPPPKLLLDSPGGGSGISSDELSFGVPESSNKRAMNARRKRMARRTMRRCSTGGALDKFCKPPQSSESSSSHESPPRPEGDEHHGTTPTPEMDGCLSPGRPGSGDVPTLSVSSKQAAQTQTTLKNLMNLAVTHPTKIAPKQVDLGYEDIGPTPAHQDELPSMQDLGYGDFNGQDSIMSIGTSFSREELGYGGDTSCANLGYCDQVDHHFGRDLPALARMPRRCSAGSGRRGSNGLPRRGSTTGTYCSHRARRRSSNKGEQGRCRAGRRSSVGGGSGASSSQTPHHFRRRRSSVGGAPSVQQRSALGNMLGGGYLMRSDSMSSIGSEVSVKAALLYAGNKKNANANTGDAALEEDDSNISSSSPVSVSVMPALGYKSVFRSKEDPLSCSADSASTDPADSASESVDHVAPIQVQDESSQQQHQHLSKKEYWKSRLNEANPPPARQEDDILSYRQRRARRKSMTTACA